MTIALRVGVEMTSTLLLGIRLLLLLRRPLFEHQEEVNRLEIIRTIGSETRK
jgi:hypothetical protein